eukprot:m.327466 g.327466  ORF g.327466 m.327466 type:complete len:130 (+) comp20414_c0_seq1:1565-1954(+)
MARCCTVSYPRATTDRSCCEEPRERHVPARTTSATVRATAVPRPSAHVPTVRGGRRRLRHCTGSVRSTGAGVFVAQRVRVHGYHAHGLNHLPRAARFLWLVRLANRPQQQISVQMAFCRALMSRRTDPG